nr:alpha carbonic anhydrase 7-like [Quercus suber]
MVTHYEMFSVTAGEEPEFDYIEGSPKGPEHWGELKPEWAECKDGRSQSPINILNKNVKIASKTGDLRLNYKASNATVKNTGFSIEFTEEIKSLVKKKEERPKGVIDPRDSNMEAVKYYKYNGSQTFPPCAEGITWIINEKVNTVSNEQVQLLREANFDYAKNNARPVQALNGREIFRYC